MSRLYLVVAGLLLATCAAAQGTKIGFVNSQRIESESIPFSRALEALKKEFAAREQQLQSVQKQINADRDRFEKERDKLPAAEVQSRGQALADRMRKSDQAVFALGEDIDRRKNERAAKLLEEVNAVIKMIAEAGKYDLILQQATYAGPGIDITDQVLKELAKRSK